MGSSTFFSCVKQTTLIFKKYVYVPIASRASATDLPDDEASVAVCFSQFWIDCTRTQCTSCHDHGGGNEKTPAYEFSSVPQVYQ